jgi:PhnB protein
MKVQPYFIMNGKAEEAANFYKTAVGAEIVVLMRWKDAPFPAEMKPPGSAEMIMHMELKIGESTVMMSDGNLKGTGKVENASLTILEDNLAAGQDKFKKLSEGGTVTMPMEKTFFAAGFGSLTDKFGLPWQVVVNG